MNKALCIALFAACTTTQPPDSSGTGSTDGKADGTGSSHDACAPHTGAFSVEIPPSFGSTSDVSRTNAIVQVTPSGPRVLQSQNISNGSSYDATLVALTRSTPGTWQTSSLADGGLARFIANDLAATSGTDPCVAYDDNGALHLQCTSSGDRTVAPSVANALAIASTGSTKHLVYGTTTGDLVYRSFDGDPRSAEVIDADVWPTEVQIAVDHAGDVHVAYSTQPTTSSHEIHYAIRHAGTWTVTRIYAEQWTSGTANIVGLALALTDAPTIAFHGAADRSLRLARLNADGTWAIQVLVAADPGFDLDDVGAGIALRTDCDGRLHIVYQRNLSSDPHPNSELAYARVDGSTLVSRAFLPQSSSSRAVYQGYPFSLGFVIDKDGAQHVSAIVGSNIESPAYYFER